MKKYLVDIVNLNADASCLSAQRWLSMLEGGKESYFYQFLNIYVKTGKKASLGIPGATIADIVKFNQESIDLINNHPEIFEIILRPFSHDIALLRSIKGFKMNLEIGIQTLYAAFGSFTPFYLPPEFMLTSEQINAFQSYRIAGTFINPTRFRPEIRNRIPTLPYEMQGMFNSTIQAIPFEDGLTKSYLNSIHHYDAREWNKQIMFSERENIFCWRDGESSFFIPDGNVREQSWLETEHPDIERVFLKDLLPTLNFANVNVLPKNNYRYYPVHSFSAWMKEFRMLGFIQSLQKIEERIDDLSFTQLSIWLNAINSDILSAVEKDSPVIKIQKGKDNKEKQTFTIWRSERNFEGQEYLNILEHADDPKIQKYLNKNNQPHIQKLRSRIAYLHEQGIL